MTNQEYDDIIIALEEEMLRQKGTPDLSYHLRVRNILVRKDFGGIDPNKSTLGYQKWVKIYNTIHSSITSRNSFYEYLRQHLDEKKRETHIINGETVVL